MTAPEVNAERLAALIEGRLPPDEREKVMEAIDASPELREAYADALAALGAMTPAPARPIDRRRVLPSLTALQWLGLAAAAAVVVAVTPSLIRRFGPASVPDSRALIASVPLSDSVAFSILGQPVWGATRGNAEASLSTDARAIRVGAAIASFEMRHGRADSSTAASAVEIANLLETFPGGTNAANAYRAFGTTVSAADAAVQSAGRLAEQAAGRRVVRLGAWLQAARFAAAAQDTAYFSGSVPRAISRAAIAMDGRAGAESAAHQLEQIARQRPHDWIALGTAVEELLRLLGTS